MSGPVAAAKEEALETHALTMPQPPPAGEGAVHLSTIAVHARDRRIFPA